LIALGTNERLPNKLDLELCDFLVEVHAVPMIKIKNCRRVIDLGFKRARYDPQHLKLQGL